MDKIILATTLAALMSVNGLPASGREAGSVTGADRAGAARDHLTAARQAARPQDESRPTDQA
jgi:hypothetical protein